MLHNIKRLGEAQGMTIAEIERRAGIAHSTIARWDVTKPAVDKVARVAKVLGVTIEELLEDPEDQEAC